MSLELVGDGSSVAATAGWGLVSLDVAVNTVWAMWIRCPRRGLLDPAMSSTIM